MIAEALHALLNGTEAVTTACARYRFETGESEAAAIFTRDPAPEDCGQPCIVITEDGGETWGTRTKKGGNAQADIRIFGDKQSSHNTIRALAWAVWLTVNRAHLDVAGFEEAGCFASLPQQSTDQDGYPFFRVPVRVRILEE